MYEMRRARRMEIIRIIILSFYKNTNKYKKEGDKTPLKCFAM
jgi:hypothetical protein